jgi:glutaminase
MDPARRREALTAMHPESPTDCTSPVLDYLQSLHAELAPVTEGTVATYIPELAKADPRWFGICLVTLSGKVYEVGDAQQPFTIQSISKPFVYGMALEDNGRQPVLDKVNVEPTGDAFNSISLEPGTGRPRNPMINAGAIATTGLIAGARPASRLRRILKAFALHAGRELVLDEAVYRSESQTGHRNRAIGHLLRNFGIIGSDPDPVVELYFQQCAISVTCRDLGIMAATLANRGVNPVTGRQALRGEYVESVLSVMGSCGMYDYAGGWIYHVGMPAKSGVAGGILAVLPGQLGIGVFSPPLDARGNSVRGIRVCDALSRAFDLHLFNRTSPGRSALRHKLTAAESTSNRVRTPEEARVLRESGGGIQVLLLQGHLTFTTTEPVIEEVMQNLARIDALVLDLKRVLSINEGSCRLVHRLQEKLRGQGKVVAFTHPEGHALLRRYMKVKLGERFDTEFRTFADTDHALEWCEDRLLERQRPGSDRDRAVAPADYELLRGLSPEQVDILSERFERCRFQAGEVILRLGEPAAELYFLARGQASVFVASGPDTRKRLATFSPGMVFGEMAVIDGAPRSATVLADTAVECDRLSATQYAALSRDHPDVKIRFLENLALRLTQRLRERNRGLGVLD